MVSCLLTLWDRPTGFWARLRRATRAPGLVLYTYCQRRFFTIASALVQVLIFSNLLTLGFERQTLSNVDDVGESYMQA